MASKLARMLAAQAWCEEATKHKEMDIDLAEAFAEILDSLNIHDKLKERFLDEETEDQDEDVLGYTKEKEDE